jgi:hypothetical protein
MRRTTVAKRKARRELGLHAEGPDEQLSLRVRPRRKAVHEADVHFVAVPFDFSDGEGLIDVASALAVCGDKSDLLDRCATVRQQCLLKGRCPGMLRDRGQIGRSAYTGFRHSLEVWPAVPHLPHVSKARGLHIAGECPTAFKLQLLLHSRNRQSSLFPPYVRLCCRACRNSSNCRCWFDVSRRHSACKLWAKDHHHCCRSRAHTRRTILQNIPL